ncbi:MAG: uroporphyrinogen-III C-methyltransferase [Pseudomonadota bacterium]
MSTKGDSPKANKPVANKNAQKTGGAVLGFFVFLTFIIAVGGIGAGYYYWQKIEQTLRSAEVERQSLKHALSTVDENPRFQKLSRDINKKVEDGTNKLKDLQDSVKVIQEDQKQAQAILDKTRDLVSRGQTEWRLNEVEHILRMSQYRLLLDRDITSAQAGLKAADTGLNEINDVRLIPIRTSISKQIQALNNFPLPDYVGIQLELDNTIAHLKTGLISQAKTVATKQPTESISSAETQITEKSEKFVWNYENIWQTTKTFVVNLYEKTKTYINESIEVTRGEHKVAVFIEQQEKKRAYEFLRTKLLAAKYSVSTRDDNSYHQQLNAAIAWLENNDEFTNKSQLINEIKELNKIDISPVLPDISQPSLLLAKYIEKARTQQ